jgi:two-component system sensor histidine kinase AlgZ
MKSLTKAEYRVPHIWIAFAWSCVALAWGPAAALAAGASPTLREFAVATAFCFASFLPWALATRRLFRLCERHPLGEGRDAFSVIALLLTGVVVIPLLTSVLPAIQAAIAFISSSLFGPPQPLAALARRIIVTSLFAVPTYVAVIAVGQTFVWARRARHQEARSARAELRALQAELSPHFLMNALGSIAQMAHASADRAEAALSALANVLRSGLTAENEMSMLADELGAVDEHLLLYRELNGCLDYRRAVDDGLWQRLLPSRILIPLVENALTHGNTLPDGTRHVDLRVTAAPHGTRIEIGNPASAVARASHGLNSGLDHVRQRLAILYQDRFRMTVARDGSWFSVVLELPDA